MVGWFECEIIWNAATKCSNRTRRSLGISCWTGSCVSKRSKRSILLLCRALHTVLMSKRIPAFCSSSSASVGIGGAGGTRPHHIFVVNKTRPVDELHTYCTNAEEDIRFLNGQLVLSVTYGRFWRGSRTGYCSKYTIYRFGAMLLQVDRPNLAVAKRAKKRQFGQSCSRRLSLVALMQVWQRGYEDGTPAST